ncbi:hypothetical protein GOP47_0017665 [Adiantum capillus-veneris]|uniref:TATA box binding protein associated factor (TAF) histone-like fold domain-containing protein n=1 Tax=Adiantum capillus-veneris TaxID=13818 RepID=A0A9D4UG98_ADICA|nr:hypothetical protein GOP47_0017665 [Adiantum capillus-veneris]
MTILLKETIQVIAQSIGISNLSDEVAAALAPDVEYRMREIMQEAIKCMLHSKRTILTMDDVNSALQLRNVEPLYGFASGGPLRFKRAIGHPDLFYIDDGDVEFKEVMEVPLPKVPLDSAVVTHWLAIEGVQPAIPENVPLEVSMPSLDSKKIDTLLGKQKDDEFGVEIKLPVKHVLSQELQLYFEKITDLIITRASSPLFKAALTSLATDAGLHPLVPYFTQFIADEVGRNLDDVDLLLSLMMIVRSLLVNPHIHIDLYLHQLMPSVITCLVAKRLGKKLTEDHWKLRDYVANLISFICRRFGHSYHNLQPRITRTLMQALLDPKRALTQHYGAIKGLAALGPRVVGLMVLPNVEAFMELLTPELSMETQKNEIKRHEAMRVFNTLLVAVGVCMSSRVKSCPRFFLPHAWNPGGKGRIGTSAQKSDIVSDASALSQLTITSPRKRTGNCDGMEAQHKKPLVESLSMEGPSFDSSMSTMDLNSQEEQLTIPAAKTVDDDSSKGKNQMPGPEKSGSKDKLESSNTAKSSFSLSESWKEDVPLGPLFSALVDIFGEAILPFVPQTELNTFI